MEIVTLVLKLVLLVVGVLYLWLYHKAPNPVRVRLDAGMDYAREMREAREQDTELSMVVKWSAANQRYHLRTTRALSEHIDKVEKLLWAGILLLMVSLV